VVCDAAYNSVPFARRRQLHRSVAEWYENEFESNLAPHLALLAHHWTRPSRWRRRSTIVRKPASSPCAITPTRKRRVSSAKPCGWTNVRWAARGRMRKCNAAANGSLSRQSVCELVEVRRRPGSPRTRPLLQRQNVPSHAAGTVAGAAQGSGRPGCPSSHAPTAQALLR